MAPSGIRSSIFVPRNDSSHVGRRNPSHVGAGSTRGEVCRRLKSLIHNMIGVERRTGGKADRGGEESGKILRFEKNPEIRQSARKRSVIQTFGEGLLGRGLRARDVG